MECCQLVLTWLRERKGQNLFRFVANWVLLHRVLARERLWSSPLVSGLLLSHNPYLRWRKWSKWSPEVPLSFTFLYHIFRNVLSVMICICVLEEQGKNPTSWWKSLLLNCGQDVSSGYQCCISAKLTMNNCTEIGFFFFSIFLVSFMYSK